MKARSRIVQATGIFALAMVASRILGYVREIIIYSQFGQNRFTDVYKAAFSIPDSIYLVLVGGALSAAFIPVFSSYLAADREEEAWEVASVTLNVICIIMVILLFLAYFFTPQLVGFMVTGFDASSRALTVTLTRIMLLQVVFMVFAGISSGILQSFNIFGPTAVGSVVYNLVIVLIGGLFSSIIERKYPGFGIAAFSVGVVAGALGTFLIQAAALRRVGLKYHFSFNIRHPGFVNLITLMLPVLVGLSANQISFIINQKLSSGLEEGLLSALTTAQRFMQLPVSTVAISIAIALFPTLSVSAAKNEMADFRRDFSKGIRSITFICIPCSVLLGVLAVPLIRFMFEFPGGSFNANDTNATAYALYFFVIGIFAQGCIHLLSRAFYALQNTRTPVIMAVIGIVINIVFSIQLVKLMSHGGLALAYSIAGIINMLLLMLALKRKLGHIGGRKMFRSGIQTLIASAVMGTVAYSMAWGIEILWGTATKLTQAVQLLSTGATSLAVFLIITKMLKMPEVNFAYRMVKNRFHY